MSMTEQPKPMGSSFFGAVNPAMQAFSKVGTALGANFAADPRQRELFQLQQQQEQQADQQRTQQGIELWMSAVDDMANLASQPGSEAAFRTPGIQKIMQNLSKMGGEYLTQGGYDATMAEMKLAQVMELAMMPKPGERIGPLSPGQTYFDENAQPLASVPATPPEAPTPIQEYNLAVSQGYKGTYEDFDMARRTASADRTSISTVTNTAPNGVQYPTPEPGYDYMRGPDGQIQLFKQGDTGAYTPVLVKLPGGEPAEAAAAASLRATTAEQTREEHGDVVLDALSRAAAMVKSDSVFNTAMGRALLKDIPGTTAKNLQALIKTIRSQIGFEQIQIMRGNSPTGAALGPVSNFEVEELQAMLGNLDVAQTADQLLYNMSRLQRRYIEIVHGPGALAEGQAPQAAPGGGNVINFDAQGNRVTP